MHYRTGGAAVCKGQLTSEGIFGLNKSTKKKEKKIARISALASIIAFIILIRGYLTQSDLT